MATPGGRLTYGIVFSSRRPLFVAVTLDQDDAKVFQVTTYAKVKRSFFCRICHQFTSVVDGTVPHLSPDHRKTPCRNQIEDALACTRLWAAFRANEEASCGISAISNIDWRYGTVPSSYFKTEIKVDYL